MTGDANRGAQLREATDPPTAGREGVEGRPGSQETCLRRKPEALVERGGSMPISRRVFAGVAGVFLSLAATCVLTVASSAASVTVNVRIEGHNATLFEGPVATGPEEISTSSSSGPHPCDFADNGANEGFGPKASEPTTALHDALTSSGLAFDATWSTSYKDFFITDVGPDTDFATAGGFAVNYTTAPVGGCQFQLAPGSEVLWSSDYFNKSHLLRMTGPASVEAGVPFAVHVTDGQTGELISGAAVGTLSAGVTATDSTSPQTNASGDATLVFTHAGAWTLKATRADSVRSNGVVVCVHSGNDGTCGTTVAATKSAESTPSQTTKPQLGDVPRIIGLAQGHVYRRRHAPRVLRGVVKVPVGGTLGEVRISLERRYRGGCFHFNGTSEKFVRSAKCGVSSFFSVGSSESFSYLLPASLPPGRYAYKIQVSDFSGHFTNLIGGQSDVVFRVK